MAVWSDCLWLVRSGSEHLWCQLKRVAMVFLKWLGINWVLCGLGVLMKLTCLQVLLGRVGVHYTWQLRSLSNWVKLLGFWGEKYPGLEGWSDWREVVIIGIPNGLLMAMQVHVPVHLACTDRHCLPQKVFKSPQTPITNPYNTYKMAPLCVLYTLLDTQFILAGANTADRYIYNVLYSIHDNNNIIQIYVM